jgi:hypothetical protein
MSKGYTYRKYYENIANAIREKNGTNTTYKTSEMANAIKELKFNKELNHDKLQNKNITLTNNNTYTIKCDENFYGLNKINLLLEVFEGYNFKSIGYSDDFSALLNENKKNIFLYSFNLKNEIENNPSDNWYEKFLDNTLLIYMPYTDTSNVTRLSGTWKNCSSLQNMPNELNISNVTNMNAAWYNCEKLQNMPEVLDTSNVTNMTYTWDGCRLLPRINLTSVAKVTDFSRTWGMCTMLTFLHFTEWKQGNISLSNSSKLEAESIHYIIQNAMNISDGAVNRTLTLQSTAKTNWQNSAYYNDDLALLTTKGISVA